MHGYHIKKKDPMPQRSLDEETVMFNYIANHFIESERWKLVPSEKRIIREAAKSILKISYFSQDPVSVAWWKREIYAILRKVEADLRQISRNPRKAVRA